MNERTISRSEWRPFCQGFSGEHEGWLVTVDVHYRSGAARTLIRDEPLAAVEAEGPGGSITVTIGRRGAERRLDVAAPSALRFRETREGAHQGLRIEAADGTAVDVRFRAAARPEALDGFVEPGRPTPRRDRATGGHSTRGRLPRT